MGPLDYQLLLTELRAIRKELESQLDGLRQTLGEPTSTAIATTPSPPTVQLPTPYHDDSIAFDQIHIESGLTATDPHAPLGTGQKLVQCGPVDIEDIPASDASAAFSACSSAWVTPAPVPPSASATAKKRARVPISRVPVGTNGRVYVRGVRRRYLLGRHARGASLVRQEARPAVRVRLQPAHAVGGGHAQLAAARREALSRQRARRRVHRHGTLHGRTPPRLRLLPFRRCTSTRRPRIIHTTPFPTTNFVQANTAKAEQKNWVPEQRPAWRSRWRLEWCGRRPRLRGHRRRAYWGAASALLAARRGAGRGLRPLPRRPRSSSMAPPSLAPPPPTPIQLQVASSLVPAAAWSRSATVSMEALKVFDEMSSSHSCTTAAEFTPQFVSLLHAVRFAMALHSLPADHDAQLRKQEDMHSGNNLKEVEASVVSKYSSESFPCCCAWGVHHTHMNKSVSRNSWPLPIHFDLASIADGVFLSPRTPSICSCIAVHRLATLPLLPWPPDPCEMIVYSGVAAYYIFALTVCQCMGDVGRVVGQSCLIPPQLPPLVQSTIFLRFSNPSGAHSFQYGSFPWHPWVSRSLIQFSGCTTHVAVVSLPPPFMCVPHRPGEGFFTVSNAIYSFFGVILLVDLVTEAHHHYQRLQAKILNVVDLSYGGKNSFNHTIELSADHRAQEADQSNFRGLSTNIDLEVQVTVSLLGWFASGSVDNIIYARAYIYEHRNNLRLGLAAKITEEPFRLLIVDSVIAVFCVDFSGRGDLAERQHKLAQMLFRLTAIAEEFHVTVYITNPVIADLGGGMFITDPKKPAGGHVLAPAATIRLMPSQGKATNMSARPSLPLIFLKEMRYLISIWMMMDSSISEMSTCFQLAKPGSVDEYGLSIIAVGWQRAVLWESATTLGIMSAWKFFSKNHEILLIHPAFPMVAHSSSMSTPPHLPTCRTATFIVCVNTVASTAVASARAKDAAAAIRLLHTLLVCVKAELQNSSFLLNVAFADLLHTHFVESRRRLDTCVALFSTGEELISLTVHRSLLRLRQEHPRLLLHAQRQRGGRVVFPADASSSTNSAAT